jgi:3-phenylpropionate/cinnamic acid dioxygenase small subunit
MLETLTTNRRIEQALLRIDVEDFLWLEAELLDEHRYEEWLELFTADVKYWMPIRRNVASKEMERESPAETDIAFFNSNYQMLEKRVRQIRTGVHWADEPLSRVTHMVSNVRILDASNPDEVRVSSRFIFHRNRHQREESTFFGKRIDTLRRVDDAWKIARREIYIDESVMLHKNLTSFL